ncbi:T9SS type A sorting domain-containing protein [bacterium]|nr:T9SS type A sorting domain-containing protein [bacterium]
MRLRCFKSVLLCFVTGLFILHPLLAQSSLKVTILDNNTQIYDGTYSRHIALREMIGIKLVARYKNDSGTAQTFALNRRWGHTIPDMLDRWEDSSHRVANGEEIAFTKHIFVHAENTDTIRFTVEAVVWSSTNTPLEIRPVNFEFIVDPSLNAAFEQPVFLDPDEYFSTSINELSYLPGTTVSVNWQATEPLSIVDGFVQELYYFDMAQPENLVKAASNLYKISSAADQQKTSVFGLEDGHTYGYIIKSSYHGEQRSINLYSKPIFATQDNSPPNTVDSPEIELNFKKQAVIQWTPITDVDVEGGNSGVVEYQVYRGLDTSDEQYVASVSSDITSMVDTARIINVPFYYLIKAVDAVGNIGRGTLSEIQFQTGQSEWPHTDEEESNEIGDTVDGYIATTIDTLWIPVDQLVQQVRFITARNDSTYFENTPASSMDVFDSGWIRLGDVETDPAKPGYVYWTFDYAIMANGEQIPDLNYVSGHSYFRRGYIKDVDNVVLPVFMPRVMIDIMPPSDIHNLVVNAFISDVSLTRLDIGHNEWHIDLNWDMATDDASGISGYNVFRHIEGSDPAFDLIASIKQLHYRDTEIAGMELSSGTIINYRITAFDGVGNQESYLNSNWQIGVMALAAPAFRFDGYSSSVDTLYSNVNTIDIDISHFNRYRVRNFTVSMNDEETVYTNTEQNILSVNLAATQFSRIKLKADFEGGRTTTWSATRIVSMRNLVPDDVVVINSDPDSVWSGNLVVQWNKSSLDVHHYVLERKINSETEWSVMDDFIISGEDTVRWRDRYTYDESAGETGDTLITYMDYQYRVKAVDGSGENTTWVIAQNYCAKPPLLFQDELIDYNGDKAVKITWNRTRTMVDKSFWWTQISVSVNNDDNSIFHTDSLTSVFKDTSFIFAPVIDGNNYIFNIKERVLEDGRTQYSSWSKPYTVNYIRIDSLFVTPQPHADVFIHWGNDVRLKTLPVAKYTLTRIRNSIIEQVWEFGTDEDSYMDMEDLLHGNEYHYRLEVLNDLDQVISWGDRAVTVDSGMVYVPEVMFSNIYFNGDSLTLAWQWKDVSGQTITDDMRGASRLMIRTSVDATFPDHPDLTVSTGWFTADCSHKKVDIPASVNDSNEKVYCQITAQDRWNNPVDILWSNVVVAIFDDVVPTVISNLGIDKASSYYRLANSVRVDISWDDNSIITGEPLAANLHGYLIARQIGEVIDTVGFVQSYPDIVQYQFQDTCLNSMPQYAIISVDSAENMAISSWLGNDEFLTTPEMPVAVSHDSVSWTALADSDVMYLLEAATKRQHFIWAHEIGFDDPENRFLCRSQWQNQLSYVCNNGWGATERDTTWFRVKAQKQSGWESGWSVMAYYTETDGHNSKTTDVDESQHKPESFYVLPNYPNPFNGETILQYYLPASAKLDIRIYNINGRLIKHHTITQIAAGVHRWQWNVQSDSDNDVATGMYLLILDVNYNAGGSDRQHQKLMYIK